MVVLFDIVHPAHVHFFKHIIRGLQKVGYNTPIVARDKDVTLALLDQLSTPGSSPLIPFRAARTPFDVRCRHFDSAARTACCRLANELATSRTLRFSADRVNHASCWYVPR